MTWSEVEVVRNDEAAANLREITLKVPEKAIKAYTTPGQFVQLKTGDEKPGFFAIASPPKDDEVMEFLIKETDKNGWLTNAKAGISLDMSDVAGNGYDFSEWQGGDGTTKPKYDGFACTNYLFFAQGTGIAPIRAAIESGVAKDGQMMGTLMYGVQDKAHSAYRSKFPTWQSDFNVKTIEVHSKPEPDWKGPQGYVQQTLMGFGTIPVPRNSGAIICGNKDFFTDIKALLLKYGMFEDRILTNF